MPYALRPNSCPPPSARYDEKLHALQQQLGELQQERLDLMQKLNALQHASGAAAGALLSRLACLLRKAAAAGGQLLAFRAVTAAMHPSNT